MIEFRNILIKVKKGRCFVAKFRMDMTGGDVRDAILPIFKAQAAASGHDLTDDQIDIVVMVEREGDIIETDLSALSASVTVDVPDSKPS